jgi:Trk K+ transport system NAD-binding subunit
VTGSRRDVLLVPREALAGWDVVAKTARLFVVEGGQARTRAVRTGSVSEAGVEILSGVKAGETCIVRGAFNVKEGDRLIVATRSGGEKP